MTDDTPQSGAVEWLTYDELGGRLGIAPASALRRAMRGRWARRRDPDGEARCAVPIADLQPIPSAIAPPSRSKQPLPDPFVSLAYLHSRAAAVEWSMTSEHARVRDEQAEWARLEAELRDAKARAEGGLAGVLRVVEIQAAARYRGS